jgi:hypothetical protein
VVCGLWFVIYDYRWTTKETDQWAMGHDGHDQMVSA